MTSRLLLSAPFFGFAPGRPWRSILKSCLLVWLAGSFLASSVPVSLGQQPSHACSNKVVDKNGVAVTRKIRILEKPDPQRTEKARANGTEGYVILSVVLNELKKVTDITVVQGLPDGLTEAAISQAEKIRFEPALKDGCPKSVKLSVEYHFSSDK